MKLIIRQLELPLTYNEEDIKTACRNRLNCKIEEIKTVELIRRSVDTRPRRKVPVYVASAEAVMSSEFKLDATLRDVEKVQDFIASTDSSHELEKVSEIKRAAEKMPRPVVAGAGPAGLMAALQLSLMGLKPVLLEQGPKSEERKQIVDDFWRRGVFLHENNVLCGEGGAGLFSDGKLTARSKDKPRMRLFFETLVRCGAPREILIDAEPHIGSDVLLKIVPGIRRMIEENGGETIFNCKLTDIFIENKRVTGVRAGNRDIETGHLVLATGHSAKDIYQMLAEKGAELAAKPFAVGVRLEIPQSQINLSQYGGFVGTPGLKTAPFKLTRKPERSNRACYSFCMCPGGLVIACASENNALTTNGMSYSSRSGYWGNAAFIVPVNPEDYAGCEGDFSHPALAGLNFQAAIERAAFKQGGKDFSVPALMLNDFIKGKLSAELPENLSCPRSVAADFSLILPEFVRKTLQNAIPPMLKELNCVDQSRAIIYAAETRSSSPVRIERDDSGQLPEIRGLFPAGEGAGYAGGIVSSAIDGIKAAEMLIASVR